MSPSERRAQRLVVCVMSLVTLAAALGLHRWKGYDAQYRDPDGFGRMGQEVAAGKGLLEEGEPSAFRGPVVPLVFAMFFKVFGDSYEVLHVVQCVFFALANGVLGTICARVFESWRTTLASMLIYIGFVPAHPWFLNIFAEPIFTTCVAVFMLCWMISLDASEAVGGQRTMPQIAWSLATGLALAAAALTRPVMYYFLPFVIAYELYRRGRTRMALVSIASLLIGFALLETPWIIRNLRVVGRPIVTTTGSSQAIFLATWYQEANWLGNPYHDPQRFPPAAEGFWQLPKAERDAQFQAMAAKNWREDPVAVLMLIPKRAMMFLFQMNDRGWLPTPKSIVVAGGLYVLAILGYVTATSAARRRYGPAFLLVAFNVVFHALLASEYRYSHPVQAYIFMLAAAGLVHLWSRWTENTVRTSPTETSLAGG